MYKPGIRQEMVVRETGLIMNANDIRMRFRLSGLKFKILAPAEKTHNPVFALETLLLQMKIVEWVHQLYRIPKMA